MTVNPSASGWLATPDSIDGHACYDEERLRWESRSPWHTWARKNLRLPRLRRVGLGLLLLDLMIVGFLLHTFNPLITLLRRNEELFGARLTLPLDAPFKDDSQAPHKIPRILHQTSATTVIPDKWKESVDHCKEIYSEFEYMHWTDASARDFIAAEYAWALDLWDNYPFPIQRADAIRYFVLHKYGGLYLDMDTTCNRTIPLNYIESNDAKHHAVFKSTSPTGVSNDLLITTANHPVFAKALSHLRFYNDFTTIWAHLLPHAAVMIAAGPLFLTMATKNYLLEQPSLPEQTVQVINATELLPYITDLEGSSWHHGDTKFLMWLEHKPWIWFLLAAIGLAIGLHLINYLLLKGLKRFDKGASASDELELKRYRD